MNAFVLVASLLALAVIVPLLVPLLRRREGLPTSALLSVVLKWAQAELDALAEAPDEIDARRRALLSQLSQAETLRKAAADRLQEAENRLHAQKAVMSLLARP